MKEYNKPLFTLSLHGFSWRLRQALNASGNNQQWLADATMLSQSYVSRLLTGNRSPSLRILYRLAHVLRVSPDSLWKGDS